MITQSQVYLCTNWLDNVHVYDLLKIFLFLFVYSLAISAIMNFATYFLKKALERERSEIVYYFKIAVAAVLTGLTILGVGKFLYDLIV